MTDGMSMHRSEILGAWLVAGLALTALGIAPLLGVRESTPGVAAEIASPRSNPATRAGGGQLPLVYDAEDFGEWLARRGGEPVASGPTDADS